MTDTIFHDHNLVREARVTRTGFYARTDPRGNQRPGAYQHLAEEFQRRLIDLRKASTIPNPRELQIARLKDENAKLRERVREREVQITEFKERALSQLTAQHEEILWLRQRANSPNNVRSRDCFKIGSGVLSVVAERDSKIILCTRQGLRCLG